MAATGPRFRRHFQVVHPRLISMLGIYGLMWIPALIVPGEGTVLRSCFVLIVVAVYGLYRCLAFHPSGGLGHGAWLDATPWKHPQPLPMGPVLLGAADVVVLGVAAALLHLDGHFSPAMSFVVGLSAYQLVLGGVFLASGGWAGLVLLVGVPAVGLLWREPVQALAWVFVLDGVARIGMPASLAAFRRESRGDSALEITVGGNPAGRAWERLRAESGAPTGSFAVAAIGSAYAGWLCYVVLRATGLTAFGPGDSSLVFGFLALLLTVVRLSLYLGQHSAPISLWGRVRTARFVVPGFDVIFLAPIAAVAFALLLPRVLVSMGVGGHLALALSLATVIFVLCWAPPSPRRWILTGKHRIRLQPAWYERETLVPRERS